MGNNTTSVLNRVFSRNTLSAILEGKEENPYAIAVRRYVADPQGKKNWQIISEIYRVLNEDHRNEYFYKNSLLNNLLLHDPHHNLRNTVALTEIPVGRSKVDLVLINGLAHVYEIKTELDNFDRLDSQINNYYKAFDHVSVVTCLENIDKLTSILSGTHTGIIVLQSDSTLVTVKPSEEDQSQLDHVTMFKIMRKQEYSNIITKEYESLPDVSQFEYFTACKELFCQIDINKAYHLFLSELKKRSTITEEKYFTIPDEMKSLIYFSKLRATDYDKIERFLHSYF